MIRVFTLVFTSCLIAATCSAQLIITAVYDADLPGGLPKGVELYASEAIADMSTYGIGSANNGGGSGGEEFTFSGSASEGQYIYVTSDSAEFNQFFGFDADFYSDAMLINGDDAVELFKDGSVIDVFGEIDTDGTGQPWEYTDGWATRKSGTGPDGSAFTLGNWEYSGVGALDGEDTNDGAAFPVPIMTYGDTTGGGGPDVTVVAAALKFTPRDITIEVGQTVRWNNPETSVAHNVNGQQDVFPCNPVGFFSGVAEDGPWDFDFTFNRAGFYEYQCDPHIGVDMFGSVTVIDPNAPAYPAYNIPLVTTVDADGVADSVGTTCTLTGVVYGNNIRPGGLQFTIIDADGNGIGVFDDANNCYEVTEGDMIEVIGTVDQFGGLTQIEPDDAINVLSEGNALRTPETVTGPLGEDTESRYIKVEDLVVDSVVSTGTSGWNVFTHNDNASYVVRMDGDLFDDPLVEAGNMLTVTGIGGQFDTSLPYTDGYQIVPQSEDDLEISASVEYLADESISMYPNPTSGMVWLKTDLTVEQIEIFDQTGRLVSVDRQPQFDLTELSSGTYIIKVHSAEGVWRSRIVKVD